MTQGDQCEQLNLGQHPERSKVTSVCGVTEDYKENFQKAVLQKRRKEQVFNIHQQHVRFFFLRWERLKHVRYSWERASREAKVEDQGLTCKGMVAVGDTGCEAHWSEAHVRAIRMEMRGSQQETTWFGFSYWEGSSRGIISRVGGSLAKIWVHFRTELWFHK